MRMVFVAGLLTVALFVAVLGAVGAAPGLAPVDNAQRIDGARDITHRFVEPAVDRDRG